MLADKGINLHQQTARYRNIDALYSAFKLFHIDIHQQPLSANEILRMTCQMRFNHTRKWQHFIHFKQRFKMGS
ncbi:hypothetical protein PGS1_13072 [Enterobacter cloacae subsp. cloacae GS1]|nr:hypothetical protein PGS1_13072 [Enterobacter cloacae subsp. cloacae GS1]